MNFASTVEADFFDEQGLLKEYRPPVQQHQHPHQQQQQQQTGGMFALKKIPIANLTPSSVSDPDPVPDPTPDFPFQEFPLTEVVNQSQKIIPAFQIRQIQEKTTILREKPPRVQIYP